MSFMPRVKGDMRYEPSSPLRSERHQAVRYDHELGLDLPLTLTSRPGAANRSSPSRRFSWPTSRSEPAGQSHRPHDFSFAVSLAGETHGLAALRNATMRIQRV